LPLVLGGSSRHAVSAPVTPPGRFVILSREWLQWKGPWVAQDLCGRTNLWVDSGGASPFRFLPRGLGRSAGFAIRRRAGLLAQLSLPGRRGSVTSKWLRNHVGPFAALAWGLPDCGFPLGHLRLVCRE